MARRLLTFYDLYVLAKLDTKDVRDIECVTFKEVSADEKLNVLERKANPVSELQVVAENDYTLNGDTGGNQGGGEEEKPPVVGDEGDETAYWHLDDGKTGTTINIPLIWSDLSNNEKVVEKAFYMHTGGIYNSLPKEVYKANSSYGTAQNGFSINASGAHSTMEIIKNDTGACEFLFKHTGQLQEGKTYTIKGPNKNVPDLKFSIDTFLPIYLYANSLVKMGGNNGNDRRSASAWVARDKAFDGYIYLTLDEAKWKNKNLNDFKVLIQKSSLEYVEIPSNSGFKVEIYKSNIAYQNLYDAIRFTIDKNFDWRTSELCFYKDEDFGGFNGNIYGKIVANCEETSEDYFELSFSLKLDPKLFWYDTTYQNTTTSNYEYRGTTRTIGTALYKTQPFTFYYYDDVWDTLPETVFDANVNSDLGGTQNQEQNNFTIESRFSISSSAQSYKITIKKNLTKGKYWYDVYCSEIVTDIKYIQVYIIPPKGEVSDIDHYTNKYLYLEINENT